MSDAGYILATLGKKEILCQLAEEAAELSQAALKLRRAISQHNPTPMTVDEAEKNLREEIADVWVCLNAYFPDEKNGMIMDSIFDVACAKEERWVYRIRTRSRKKEGK